MGDTQKQKLEEKKNQPQSSLKIVKNTYIVLELKGTFECTCFYLIGQMIFLKENTCRIDFVKVLVYGSGQQIS